MGSDRIAAGALMCGSAMAVLGASVVVSQSLLDYPPATGQALRYGLAAVALAAVMAIVPALRSAGPRPVRVTGRQWALLAGAAASGLAAFNLFLLLALHHADPAAVSTVVGCAPLCLTVAAPLLRGRVPGAQMVLAAAIVVGGTALVHGAGRSDTVGILAAAGVLAGDLVFSLLAARLSETLGACRVAAYSCALAVPILGAFAAATGEAARWRWPDGRELAAIVFLGLVLTAGSFALWFRGLVLLGVERGGMLVGVVPVATLTVVGLQHAAVPPFVQVFGIVAVGVGLVVGLRQPPAATVDLPGPRPLPWKEVIPAAHGCRPGRAPARRPWGRRRTGWSTRRAR